MTVLDSAPAATFPVPAQGRLPRMSMGELAAALFVSPMPTDAPSATPAAQIAEWARAGHLALGELHLWWADYVARKLGAKVAFGEATPAQVGVFRTWWPSDRRRQQAIDLAHTLWSHLPEVSRAYGETVYLDAGDVLGDGTSIMLPAQKGDLDMCERYPRQAAELFAGTGGAVRSPLETDTTGDPFPL